jgi:hypothetical protein
MKNKIIVGFGIVALAVIAIVLLVDFEDSRESPTETMAVANGDLNVSVTYGRPSVRGRVIFGTAAEKALQPFGKYWRLGANEATEITFGKDVLFAGQPVKAGSYRVYAVPGADSFLIGLNSETGQWGYDEPKYDKDVLKVTVPAEKLNTPIEQLTITMDQSGSGVVIVVAWANTQMQIQVDPAQ